MEWPALCPVKSAEHQEQLGPRLNNKAKNPQKGFIILMLIIHYQESHQAKQRLEDSLLKKITKTQRKNPFFKINSQYRYIYKKDS